MTEGGRIYEQMHLFSFGGLAADHAVEGYDHVCSVRADQEEFCISKTNE